MSTSPVVPHTSWLAKVGHFLGNLLKIIATDAAPIEKIAVPVAKSLLPMFAAEITIADGIFNSIVKEAVAAEAVQAAAENATGSGPAKLEAVLTNIGPVLDGWVSANFPGASGVSKVSKAGLVSAVVAILNEVEGSHPALTP